jgi:hypothetical protein
MRISERCCGRQDRIRATLWAAARTSAAPLVRFGNLSILIDLAERGLAEGTSHTANLNCRTYSVSERSTIERSDSSIPARLRLAEADSAPGVGAWDTALTAAQQVTSGRTRAVAATIRTDLSPFRQRGSRRAGEVDARAKAFLETAS